MSDKAVAPGSVPQPQPSFLDFIQQYGSYLKDFGGYVSLGLSSVTSQLNFIHGIQSGALSRVADGLPPLAGTDAGITYVGTPGKEAIGGFLHMTGTVLAYAGVILGSVSVYQSINSWYQSGKMSLMGMVNLGTSIMGVAMGANFLAGHTAFMTSLTNPAGWAVAGAVVAGSFEAAGINDLVTNGFSWGGFATAAAGFVGTAIMTGIAAHLIFGASMFGPVGWIVAGLVAAFAFFWSWFHRPPDEEVAAKKLSERVMQLISPGPLAYVTLGTVAVIMGWPNTPDPMRAITVPSSYVISRMALAGNVPNLPLDPSGKTPTVLIEKGDGSNPPSVVIVSPTGDVDSHGSPIVTLSPYLLTKNIQFVSAGAAKDPAACYVPFFLYVGGHIQIDPNPEFTKAITTQQELLRSVLEGGLDTAAAQSAVAIASASDKNCVDPTTYFPS